MTRVTGNRFTSEDSGIDISPIIFRNGNYRSLVNEDPPVEPRSDRQSGFYFHSNHFDVFMTTSDNTNIATLGYGLTQGMRIIGNTFKQRNRAAFADVDLALGAHRATFANNLMYNCGLVMKGSIGGLREIGYNEASTQDDKIISGNTFIFDGNFNHTYVMNLVGSYWNVTGNIIRAPRLNASREFGAINFPVTDIYPITPNIKTRFPFYAVIANNLIDVRISSIKLPNNPIKASANPSLFIVRFDDNHNLSPKDWIKFSEGASYGGVRLDTPFQVVSILSAKTITINAPATTTATADGGGGNLSVIFEGPEVMGPDPTDPTKNIVLPPPSVAPLNLKRNYMIRQSVVSGNLFIGGNYSGLPTGHPTEPTLCKQIVSGNMWAVSDFFTLGDLQLINTTAAANSAVTLDETYFDELASSLREEPNSLSPKYRITGTDPNGIMIDAGFGSFFEVDTSSSSVNVKGIVNGGIGDTIMIKRKQGTINESSTQR